MDEIRVKKVLTDGTVKIEYKGTLKDRTEKLISIDTGWSREPLDLGYALMEPDDIWVETFFLNRWYNVFRIASRYGVLKGFYINITKPPVMEGNLIKWEDLALDIWVRPDGSYLILDEDEFQDLDIDEDIRARALVALEEAKDLVVKKEGPLSELRI